MSRESLLEVVEGLDLTSEQYKTLAEEIAKLPRGLQKLRLEITFPITYYHTNLNDDIEGTADLKTFQIDITEDSTTVENWNQWLELADKPYTMMHNNLLHKIGPDNLVHLMTSMVMHNLHQKSIVQVKVPWDMRKNREDARDSYFNQYIMSRVERFIVRVSKI